MAFDTTSTGSGGTTKPFFGYTGERAVTDFSISQNSAYVSPDSGKQPCLIYQVTVWASGGAQRIVLANGTSGGGDVYSSQFNPSGTADSSSARYETTKSITKAVNAGVGYVVGQHCDDGATGLGFYRTADGTGATYLRKADWSSRSSWSGDLRSIIYYDTIPGAPTLNSATDSLTFGAVDLSWTAGTNGGSAINGYRIEWSTVSNFATIAGSVADTGSTATTRTITGLNSGTLYYFRIGALNAVSDAHSGQPASVRSNVVSATPTSYGNRRNGSVWTAINTARRYDLATSQWITLTTAKRYNGSTSTWDNIT